MAPISPGAILYLHEGCHRSALGYSELVPRSPASTLAGLASLGLFAALMGCGDPPSQVETSPESGGSGESAAGASTETDSNSPPDELPPPPELLSPADGALELPLETELCWEPVEDPEGEPVRYHVYIDGGRIGEGVLGEGEGYEGPCVGPLLFAHERSYTWAVEAFEADDPTRRSEPSETWTFSTVGDGISELVFEDDFERDLGWTLEPDSASGAWVRGMVDEAYDGDALSQPSACPNSDTCLFTGFNPDGLANTADVAGGATSIVSPPFDLGGANAATVRLDRFFYKSALMAGAELRVELLVPGPDRSDEVHLLEVLALPTGEDPANAWTPVEYAACGVPMRDGSRLRLIAIDNAPGLEPGADVLEAAIDNVSVHAHDDASLCEPGLGGRCDPNSPLASCGDELLCCSQGVINNGIYRCEEPVAGLDFELPTESPESPGNGPLGCDAPDLIVDPAILEPLTTDIFVTEDTCELLEGCVGAPGWRTVLLFTTSVPNIGSRDLALGVPANTPELFHYSPCHDHYHFDEFARYELVDADELVVATGHKQAFCLLDTISWAWPFELPQFDCTNQGVSRGFSDFYEAGLPCQWVDITGVEPGEYTLRVILNPPRPEHAIPELNERDYTNNGLEFVVEVP